MSNKPDSFTFTVGKLDAGMAILIGDRAHLIEFPSLLLPPGVTSGSIVNISVHRNLAEEKRQANEFWQLQKEIFNTYGIEKPTPPKIELRNVTQTSVTLEWPTLQLATAKIRSLDIYRNNVRLAVIPSPLQNTSTKLSGLEVATEYTFHLILRTTAGTFPSNVIRVKTHTISDTSGISVCFGTVQDAALLEQAKTALRDMKAKWSDKIQIDTTHFVCSTPSTTPAGAQASGSRSDLPGVEYQRALQLSIPVVQPQWIIACHTEKTMVPISKYYLGSTPAVINKPFTRPASMAPQVSRPNSPNKKDHRHSLPTSTVQDSYPNRASSPDAGIPDEANRRTPVPNAKPDNPRPSTPTLHKRAGTMTKDFKFPAVASEEHRNKPPTILLHAAKESVSAAAGPVVLMPPTPSVTEHKNGDLPRADSDEDLGETVEVDLTS